MVRRSTVPLPASHSKGIVIQDSSSDEDPLVRQWPASPPLPHQVVEPDQESQEHPRRSSSSREQHESPADDALAGLLFGTDEGLPVDAQAGGKDKGDREPSGTESASGSDTGHPLDKREQRHSRLIYDSSSSIEDRKPVGGPSKSPRPAVAVTSSDQDESDSSPPIQRVSKTNILDDALVQVDIDALPKEEQKLERARRLAKLQRRRSGHLDTSEEEELAKTKRTVKRGARILRSMGTEPEIGHLPSEPDPTSSSDSDSDMAVAVSARRRRGKRKHQGSDEQSSASPRRHKRSRHRRPLSEVSDDDIAFETHRLERVPELRDLTEDAANGTFLYCTRCQYYLVKDSFSAAQQKNFISRYCLMHHSGGKIGGQMYVDLLQAKVREDKRSLQREEDYSADERTGSSDYEGSFIASDEE
ncbi:hypothetical protein HDV03_000105 [Kappamyces sp. JEL0829]|nr:hypothetical protein HDV03_000105 [Kappamyces sp. JEL0829]